MLILKNTSQLAKAYNEATNGFRTVPDVYVNPKDYQIMVEYGAQVKRNLGIEDIHHKPSFKKSEIRTNSTVPEGHMRFQTQSYIQDVPFYFEYLETEQVGIIREGPDGKSVEFKYMNTKIIIRGLSEIMTAIKDHTFGPDLPLLFVSPEDYHVWDRWSAAQRPAYSETEVEDTLPKFMSIRIEQDPELMPGVIKIASKGAETQVSYTYEEREEL